MVLQCSSWAHISGLPHRLTTRQVGQVTAFWLLECGQKRRHNFQGPTGSLPSLAAQRGADDTVRGVMVLEHSRDPGWMRKVLGPKTQEELTPANKHGVRLEVDRAPVEPSGRTQPVSTLPAAWETRRQDPVMPCPDP